MSELDVEEVGRLLSQPRLTKDTLVKLLKQAESSLSVLNQDPSLQAQLAPLCESLSKSDLLHHKDKDVKLLIGVCCSEIMRVLAPEPPFSDNVLKEIEKDVAANDGTILLGLTGIERRNSLLNIPQVKVCN